MVWFQVMTKKPKKLTTKKQRLFQCERIGYQNLSVVVEAFVVFCRKLRSKLGLPKLLEGRGVFLLGAGCWALTNTWNFTTVRFTSAWQLEMSSGYLSASPPLSLYIYIFVYIYAQCTYTCMFTFYRCICTSTGLHVYNVCAYSIHTYTYIHMSYMC